MCSPIVVEAAVKATAHPPALLTAAALLNIPERASIVIVAAIGLLFSLGRASALGRGLVGRHEAWATTTKTAHITAGLTARRTTGSTTIAARRAAIASITPITSRRTAALMPAPGGTAALSLIVRFTDRDWPPIEKASVERGDRLVESLIADELDEAKAPTLSCLSIKHDTCAPDLMASIFKMSAQGLIGAAE